MNNNSDHKWTHWFAWYPVKITVLHEFGRRSIRKLVWLKHIMRRRVDTDHGTKWQYVTQDDLTDYLTLEYSEFSRISNKKDRA